MIQLERVHLPDGLRALAYRDRHGNLVIYVSERLDAKGQRAAVMEAVRASRRAGWRKAGLGLPPAGIALFLVVRGLLRHALRTIGARPVAWGAAATATAVGASAAAIFVVAAPHPHHPSAGGQPSGPGAVVPARRSGAHARHRPQVRPVAAASVSPGPGRPPSSGRPRPAPTSPGAPGPAPAPGPSPSPSPAPAPGQPAPSPSPSPTSPPPGTCVIVLGIKVCVPPLTVALKV